MLHVSFPFCMGEGFTLSLGSFLLDKLCERLSVRIRTWRAAMRDRILKLGPAVAKEAEPVDHQSQGWQFDLQLLLSSCLSVFEQDSDIPDGEASTLYGSAPRCWVCACLWSALTICLTI